MYAAPSVIIFTLCSGAGLGLLIVFLALRILGIIHTLPLVEQYVIVGLGMLLTTIGLIASTTHLANPKNAWRAFFRFRSSWLSREGVFAVLLYPCILVYILTLENAGFTVVLIALLSLICAFATVFCTGMIYASLRSIPFWNSPLVTLNFLLLACTSGSLILTVALYLLNQPVYLCALLTLFLLIISALCKGLYYFWIGSPQGPTLNTAMGITRAQIKLLDPGQSHGSFLNKEFNNSISAAKIRLYRNFVYGSGFVLPILIMVLAIQSGIIGISVLALVFFSLGMIAERWLFFVEAKHVVTLFTSQ